MNPIHLRKVLAEMNNDLHFNEKENVLAIAGIIALATLATFVFLTLIWIIGWSVMSLNGSIAYVDDLNEVMDCGVAHIILVGFAFAIATLLIVGKRKFVDYYCRMHERVLIRERSV